MAASWMSKFGDQGKLERYGHENADINKGLKLARKERQSND